MFPKLQKMDEAKKRFKNRHSLDYFSLMPLVFYERYVWLPYVFALLYTGVVIAFVCICQISSESPNTVKLYVYWIIIDILLSASMIGFYFYLRSRFKKDKVHTDKSKATKHNFFLDLCSLEPKES
jgi:hypothetical protein